MSLRTLLAGILMFVACTKYECIKTKDMGDIDLKLSWIPNTNQYVLSATEAESISGNVPLIMYPPMLMSIPVKGKLKDAVIREYYFDIDDKDTSLNQIIVRFGEEGYGMRGNFPKNESEKALEYLRKMR